jgi:hypothetical protein
VQGANAADNKCEHEFQYCVSHSTLQLFVAVVLISKSKYFCSKIFAIIMAFIKVRVLSVFFLC